MTAIYYQIAPKLTLKPPSKSLNTGPCLTALLVTQLGTGSQAKTDAQRSIETSQQLPFSAALMAAFLHDFLGEKEFDLLTNYAIGRALVWIF